MPCSLAIDKYPHIYFFVLRGSDLQRSRGSYTTSVLVSDEMDAVVLKAYSLRCLTGG